MTRVLSDWDLREWSKLLGPNGSPRLSDHALRRDFELAVIELQTRRGADEHLVSAIEASALAALVQVSHPNRVDASTARGLASSIAKNAAGVILGLYDPEGT